MKNLKKLLSFVLALVMVLSLLPTTYASAEEAQPETETTGEASALYEPWGHGYRFVDVLNWDPSTDPYSDELVAEVPLQERNETYAPTQSNPNLTDRAKLYAISSSNYRSTDVNEAPWNAAMAYDEFSYNLFKFWQYTDMTGAGGRPTEDIDRDSADKEYGTIAIPMAAATNAAHKNGVLSIAEYFLPRNPQYTEEWLQKAEDGSFPYADKLLEIMDYYGFDGYFINQEEVIPEEYVPLIKEVMQYMMDRGAYIQWYDSLTNAGTISYQNAFNSVGSDFVYDTTHGLGQVSHSMFLNYWYDTDAIKNSAAHAESLGLDPYETVYMGLEGGEWRFGIDLEAFWDIMYNHDSFAGNLMQEDGQPYTSLAIWGSDFYREQYNKADNNRYKVEYQWEAEERERMYFTSPAELVGDYDTTDIRREDVGFTYEDAFDADGNIVDGSKLGTQTNFKGISRYIVEKSVIDGTVFATDFNTGHGMEYVVGGSVLRELEWSNLNLQDILPTWQWWIEGEEVTLDMEYDYGTEYTRVQGEFPYTQIGAYNGGNSVVIYGDVQASQFVNLYKTDLNVLDSSSIALTYYKTAGEGVNENIALILEVDAETTETVLLPIETTVDGWNTVTVDLSAYAGRTIAAIGLEFSAEELVEGYQINLGRLEVADGADHTPAAPENVALELNLIGTGEYQLAWDLADYDTVKNYHVYAVYADGSYGFVGGAYADEYYVSKLENAENAENAVALEVRAVGVDGSESEGVQVPLTDSGISDIRTVSENNELVVTWTGDVSAAVELAYWYSGKEAPAAQTGVNTVTFPIEVEDGEKYVLSLTTDNGTVHYFGDLADKYADPYEGEARLQADGLYDLTVPISSDWFSLELNVNGAITKYERFGGAKLQNIAVAESGLTSMIITVTDKDGNVSEPVTKLFYDGIEMAQDGTYDETLIPDPALRAALQEQVGDTLADLLAFDGTLDLSGAEVSDLTGLTLMTKLTGLDLTGTQLEVLYAEDIPSSVTEIVLDDCGDLVAIYMDNRPDTALVLGDLPNLMVLSAEGCGNHGLNLTGAPELVDLYLSGTALEELDITANTKLQNFLIDNSQIASMPNAGAEAYTEAYYWVWNNAKLDLTDGTAEGQLMNGMKEYFANAELAERMYGEEIPLINAGTWENSGDLEVLVEVDSGWIHELTSVTFDNTYNAVNPANYFYRYNVLTATVYVSDDGENWTEVATYDDGLNWTMETQPDYNTVTIELPEGTRGRYIRMVAPDLNDGTNCFDPNYVDEAGNQIPLRNGYPYISNFTVNGYFIAYTGFFYAGQQPAVVREDINEKYLILDSADYQTLELLEEHYASASLANSGTLVRDVEGVDWIDPAYVEAEAYMPAGVRVTITDKDGNVVTHEEDSLGATEAEKLTINPNTVYAHAQNNNEEGWRLFDGMASTKWCGGDGGDMWVVFETSAPEVISKWYTLHAGSESKDFITSAYRLQYLNTEKLAEADYLAMDESGKRAIAADPTYWTDLSVVTGNSENEVTLETDIENLACAQVYRMQVDGSGQPGKQTWGALRIYELELYAFEGGLNFVGNGLLTPKNLGAYNVSYCVNGLEINATTVTVVGSEDEIPEDTKPEDTTPEDTKPEDTKPGDKPDDGKKPDAPDTGDGFNALWIFAMTISLMGAAVLVSGKKRMVK